MPEDFLVQMQVQGDEVLHFTVLRQLLMHDQFVLNHLAEGRDCFRTSYAKNER